MSIRKYGTAIILAVLALITLNYQTTRAFNYWYVSPTGSNTNDCLGPTSPCRTIQAAITKAAAADSILVQPGTYSTATNGESFPITIGKSIVIYGDNSSTTIVDAAGSGSNVFSVTIPYGGSSFNAHIFSLTIQGGNRGIEYIGYTATPVNGEISDNRITGNSVGIYTNASYVTITHNDISGNTHYGIYNDYASPTISRNAIGFNSTGGLPSTEAGIYNFHSTPSIINNLIGWNNGSGIYNDNSSPTIMNNTISINYGGSGVAAFNSSSPQITNNIIIANGLMGIHTDIPLTNTYNDVWANAFSDYYGTSPGAGSISKDPKFVSLLDAHLQCSSPAINAGTNTGAPSVDYENNSRPVGATVDMGAYEKLPPLFCLYLPLILK